MIWIILFLCLFSCHKTEELKSQVPPKYKDVPIKFIYAKIDDSGFSFNVHKIRYCYEARKYYETNYNFPVKTVKVEVYDEDDNVLNVSPIIKTYTQEQDYPGFILTILYQEKMRYFRLFRLDEKGEKISNEIYRKLLEEEKREMKELSRQKAEEKKRLTEDEDREEWEKKWDEKWEKWNEKWDKKIITRPLRKNLRYDYKTLDYINPCHYINYYLFN